MATNTLTALQVFGQSVTDASFWIAAGSVILFAHNRFRIQTSLPDTLDPPVNARSFTTRFRYGIAEFTYALFYWAIFVVLVTCGSFEGFREWLEQLVGQITLDENVAVASPAWAALVASAVLPSVPGFKTADQALRTFLHDVSSIPTKAHRLAADILAAANDEQQAPGEACRRLCAIIDQLPDKERPATARLYREFRSANRDFLEDVNKKIAKAGEVSTPHEISDYYEEILTRLSRFLSCALLSSQPDELTARQHLKRLPPELRLAVPQIGWQFRMQQIMISLLAVMGLTIVGGVIANLVLLGLAESKFLPLLPEIVWGWEFFSLLLQWTIYAVPMFMLPLIFAAGIKLYLVDRRRYRTELEGDKIPLEDRFLALAVAFVGGLFLACIPTLMGLSVRLDASITSEQFKNTVTFALLWGIPPALFAVTFILRSSVQPHLNRWVSRISDFLYHAVPVLIVSLVLAWSNTRGSDTIQNLPTIQWLFMVCIISFLISGLLGAINCSISRNRLALQSEGKEDSVEANGEEKLSGDLAEQA